MPDYGGPLQYAWNVLVSNRTVSTNATSGTPSSPFLIYAMFVNGDSSAGNFQVLQFSAAASSCTLTPLGQLLGVPYVQLPNSARMRFVDAAETLIIATTTNGFQLYNVSNPSAPALVPLGNVSLPHGFPALDFLSIPSSSSSTFALVMVAAYELFIFNISLAAAASPPQLVPANFPLMDIYFPLAIAHDHVDPSSSVYVYGLCPGCGDVAIKYNVSTWQSSTLVTWYDYTGWSGCQSASLEMSLQSGGLLLAVCGQGGLSLLLTSTGALMAHREVSSAYRAAWIHSPQGPLPFLSVAAYDSGFVSFKTQSTSLFEMTRFTASVDPENTAGTALWITLAADGSLALVANWASGIAVLHVNSSQLDFLGTVPLAPQPPSRSYPNARCAQYDEATNIVFAAENSDGYGLQWINLSSAASPPMAIATGSSGSLMLNQDHTVLYQQFQLNATCGGVNVFNISGIANNVVTLLATWFAPPGATTEHLALSPDNTMLAVALDCAGVALIGVENPSRPMLLSQILTSDCIFDVRFSPTGAFLATVSSNVLRTIDLRNTQPTLLGYFGQLSYAYACFWSNDGTAVIVADYSAGVKIFDAFDSTLPLSLGVLASTPQLRFLIDLPGTFRSGVQSSPQQAAGSLSYLYLTADTTGVYAVTCSSILTAIGVIQSPDVTEQHVILRVGVKNEGTVYFFLGNQYIANEYVSVSSAQMVSSISLMGSLPFWFSYNLASNGFYAVPTKDFDGEVIIVSLTLNFEGTIDQSWVYFYVVSSLLIETDMNGGGSSPATIRLSTPSSLVGIKIDNSLPRYGQFVMEPFGAVAASYDVATGALRAVGDVNDVNRMLASIRYAIVVEGALNATFSLRVDDTVNAVQYASFNVSNFNLDFPRPHPTVSSALQVKWIRTSENTFGPLDHYFSDGNNSLTFGVTGTGGTPFPSWMRFDTTSLMLSGAPPDVMTLTVVLTAVDAFGLSANATLSITVIRSSMDEFLYVITIIGEVASVVGPLLAAYIYLILLRNIVRGRKYWLPADEVFDSLGILHVSTEVAEELRTVVCHTRLAIIPIAARIVGCLSTYLYDMLTLVPLMDGRQLPPWMEFRQDSRQVVLLGPLNGNDGVARKLHRFREEVFLQFLDKDGLVLMVVPIPSDFEAGHASVDSAHKSTITIDHLVANKKHDSDGTEMKQRSGGSVHSLFRKGAVDRDALSEPLVAQ